MFGARTLGLSALTLAALAAKNWVDSSRVRPPENAHPLQINGLRVYAIDAGPRSARALVLLHGSSGTCWDFEPLLPSLTSHYRVIVPERPGQGWSDQPRSYRLADGTESVYRTLQALDVVNPLLIGHSYGGMVAMRMAADRPDYPAGLLLLASGGPGLTVEGHHMETWIRAGTGLLTNRVFGPLLAWTVMPYVVRLFAEHALRGNFGPDTELLTPNLVRRAKEIYARPAIILAAMREAARVQQDLAELEPTLAGIRVPTLAVTGELDRNVPGEVGEAIARAIPCAEHVRLPGVAHNFPISRPEETVRLVERLVASVERHELDRP